LSEYMRNELLAVGISASRLHVARPGVCIPDGTGVALRAPCVLFAGRLVEAKGIFHAVEAWERSGVELPLVFAGTGSGRNELERLGFEVLGWLDRGAVAALYRSAAALIFAPHWQEPFGIAGPEAMSLGTPVVAWRSGGIPEWHRGEGLLVDYGDIEGLGRALARAVAGGRIALDKPLSGGTDSLLEIYRELLS